MECRRRTLGASLTAATRVLGLFIDSSYWLLTQRRGGRMMVRRAAVGAVVRLTRLETVVHEGVGAATCLSAA